MKSSVGSPGLICRYPLSSLTHTTQDWGYTDKCLFFLSPLCLWYFFKSIHLLAFLISFRFPFFAIIIELLFCCATLACSQKNPNYAKRHTQRNLFFLYPFHCFPYSLQGNQFHCFLFIFSIYFGKISKLTFSYPF